MEPILRDLLEELKEMRAWKVEVDEKLRAWKEVMSASADKDTADVEETEKNRTIEVLLHQMDELKSENEALKAQLKEYRGEHERVETEVKQIREDRNKWVEEEKRREINFKEIMEEQKKVNSTDSKEFEKAVVRVVKSKEQIVRNTVERNKCVLLFGDVEEHIPIRKNKEEADMARTKSIFNAINEEGGEWERDIEEVKRVGKYIKEKSRPIKVQFKSKKTVEEIMTVTWRLSKNDELKHVVIRRDLKQKRNSFSGGYGKRK